MSTETFKAVTGFDLRSGIRAGANQSSSQNFRCSKPLVEGEVIHVVLNEQMPSGEVRNHFVKASLDLSSPGTGGDDDGGADGARSVAASAAPGGCRARSWCFAGRRPVGAIQGLDGDCNTLVYAQGSRFCFATSTSNEATTGGDDDGFSGTGASGVVRSGNRGGGGTREGGGGSDGDSSGGTVSDSLPVHSGTIVDFSVNPLSRDIVSGCDHGHVHVVDFPPDMVGVPTMKVSKYVAQPLSSVRWGIGSPSVASWTSSRGLLQMLDTRDNRMVAGIQVEASLPVRTHEYLSDVVLAVGSEAGCVQLFDVRKMEAFVSLQDPVAGSVRQIVPCVGGVYNATSSSSSGVGDWLTFGTTGMSRYSMGASRNNGADATVGDSSDTGVLARVAAELKYTAGCRNDDLRLPAGLDVDAGLFLMPCHTARPLHYKGQRLCGITLDSRVVTFSSAHPSRDTGGSDGGRNSAPPPPPPSSSSSSPPVQDADGGSGTVAGDGEAFDGGAAVSARAAGTAGRPASSQSLPTASPVAPADGTKVVEREGVRDSGGASGNGGRSESAGPAGGRSNSGGEDTGARSNEAGGGGSGGGGDRRGEESCGATDDGGRADGGDGGDPGGEASENSGGGGSGGGGGGGDERKRDEEKEGEGVR